VVFVRIVMSIGGHQWAFLRNAFLPAGRVMLSFVRLASLESLCDVVVARVCLIALELRSMR
jgi:hypothetical protein